MSENFLTCVLLSAGAPNQFPMEPISAANLPRVNAGGVSWPRFPDTIRMRCVPAMTYLATTFDIEALVPNPAERRLTLRLLTYWKLLRGNRRYPLLRNFEASAVLGFDRYGFMVDVFECRDKPTLQYVGTTLTADCGVDLAHLPTSEIPNLSLLSHGVAHLSDMLEKTEPVWCEGEYVNSCSVELMYRSIMLPFSNDGDSVDFIIGAVNCTIKSAKAAAAEKAEMDLQLQSSETGPAGAAKESTVLVAEQSPLALADRLEKCRVFARAVGLAESRSRQSLYRALDEMYGLYFDAAASPTAYAMLLQEFEIKDSPKAPFLPLLKLVFGVDYCKSRLGEYSTALSYARRVAVEPDGLRAFLEAQEDGVKGCVRAERAARRVETGTRKDVNDQAREILRRAPAIGRIDAAADNDSEFVLLLGRRASDAGTGTEVVRILDEKVSVVDAILNRAARKMRQED